MSRSSRVCSHRDRGSVTGFVVVMTLLVIVCAGLALDGARIVAANVQAADDAENAARVGAQELRSVRSDATTLDPARAVAAAEAYLSARGVSGSAVVAGSDIVVTVTETVDMEVLGAIGVGSAPITVTRRARPVTG